MSGITRRALVGWVAFVVVLGAALLGGDLGGVERVDGGSAGSGAAVLADSTPAGVIVPAVRLRNSLTSDYVIDGRWAKSGAADVALAGTLGLGVAALLWWLCRRDMGAAGSLPRRSPPALRAPPALV